MAGDLVTAAPKPSDALKLCARLFRFPIDTVFTASLARDRTADRVSGTTANAINFY